MIEKGMFAQSYLFLVKSYMLIVNSYFYFG